MASELHLDFALCAGRTSMHCHQHQPPWKVVRGFPLENGECLAHLNNVSGGIFGGDDLKLFVKLHPGAQAQITTTGATRVYRPRPAAAEATLAAAFRLAPNSLLEYLPDALIPYRQARVFQRTSFTLAEGATLFCWDTIAPGRAASGELFQYESLKIVSEITAVGVPILTDRLLIKPEQQSIRSAACFGESNYLVSFVALRVGCTPAQISTLEERLLSIIGAAEGRWGVTTLPAHGVLVRGMASRAAPIPSTLHSLWHQAKHLLCGRPAIAPRKTC
jgi:urease accessory protein